MEKVKQYSIRNFPESFRERLKELAKVETKKSRLEGGGAITQEGLILKMIGEGLAKMEKERGIK